LALVDSQLGLASEFDAVLSSSFAAFADARQGTKAAIAEQRKFSALLKMLRTGLA
jgi:hypothetical protein